MYSLIAELQRRHVYQVGAAYAVAAWLIAQVVTQLCPLFGIALVWQKVIVGGLFCGLPVALVLAWMFDRPSHAREREQSVPGTSLKNSAGSHQYDVARQLSIVLATLFLMAIAGVIGVIGFGPTQTALASDPAHSRDLLPLRHGRYSSSTCVDAANAALLFYDGKSLNGVHSAACTMTVSQHTAKNFQVSLTCPAQQVGEAQPARAVLFSDTVVVLTNESFELWNNDSNEVRTFHRCLRE